MHTSGPVCMKTNTQLSTSPHHAFLPMTHKLLSGSLMLLPPSPSFPALQDFADHRANTTFYVPFLTSSRSVCFKPCPPHLTCLALLLSGWAVSAQVFSSSIGWGRGTYTDKVSDECHLPLCSKRFLLPHSCHAFIYSSVRLKIYCSPAHQRKLVVACGLQKGRVHFR